jgi:cell division protease FtsH
MSDEIGPLAVLPAENQGPLLPGVSEVSQHTQEVIDGEVRRIVDASYKEVVDLLTEKREQLDALASALLEHETLDEDDAYAAAGVDHKPSEPARKLSAAAKVGR